MGLRKRGNFGGDIGAGTSAGAGADGDGDADAGADVEAGGGWMSVATTRAGLDIGREASA